MLSYEDISFKLYDSRVTDDYQGRFAIYSNNTSFKITQVTINDDPQFCFYGKNRNKQRFPEEIEPEPEFDPNEEIETLPQTSTKNSVSTTSKAFPSTSTKNMATTTPRELPTTIRDIPTTPRDLPTTTTATTQKSIPTTTETLTTTTQFAKTTEKVQSLTFPPSTFETKQNNAEETCGTPQKVVEFKKFQLPSNPGEFPYAVSIFHITNLDDLFGGSYYKCSGSIIDKQTILTSVNCLLDDNSKIIDEDNLQVHVAQYSTSATKRPSEKAYDVKCEQTLQAH